MRKQHEEQEAGEFLYHTHCGACGSSDGNAVYSNDTSYCFSCRNWDVVGDIKETSPKPTSQGGQMIDALLKGEYKDLKARGISSKICRKYGYSQGTDNNNNKCQIADYYDKSGELVAQKLRYKDKKFKFIGNAKKATLFGQNAFRSGGNQITITEGEIDALSIAEAIDGSYPVVSIPSGATSAKGAISQNIEYLNSFTTVVLWFDNDKPGQEALEDCFSLFPAGKVKVIQTTLGKDANEVLMEHGKKALRDAFYETKDYRPDGILTPADLLEDLQKPVQEGSPWCFDSLTKATYGRRTGEIYAIGAGTGVGKTDFFTQQITYDITKLNIKCGLFFLEQNPKETVRRVAGKVKGKKFHIPSSEENKWTQEELNETVQEIINTDNLFLYNSFGSTEWDAISGKIRSMVHSNDVKHIFLDHLTALASHAGDERRFLDGLMEEIASLAQELDIVIHFISHLTTPEGKAHEEGGRVQAKQFRGSRSIQQWSYFMFGLERNQQHEDEELRQVTTLRCLKDRFTGQANGVTINLKYNSDTGLMAEYDGEIDFSSEPAKGDNDDF